MSKQAQEQWRNRIVGHGEESPENLLANPLNFRVHPRSQQDALQGVLDEVGVVDEVIVNQRTGFLVNGHLRVSLAMRTNQPTIPVKYVDLSESEEALILATFDPISALATTDKAKLDEILADVQTGSAAVQEMLAGLAESAGLYFESEGQEGDSNYSRKIEAPIYEPTGPKPATSDLMDDSKTRALIQAIEQCGDIEEGAREFLIAAAHRHTVFKFNKIAEYYAHSESPMQSLMEESALVIIDFDKAIEFGFVQLTKRLAALAGVDYGEG